MKLVFLAVASIVALVGCAHHADDPSVHRHADPHQTRTAEEWARFLENPARDEWQQPQAVIAAMQIRPVEAIADIGAGTGYFSRRLAVPARKVYAVDLDPKLLEMIRQSGPPNIETVLGTPDDPRLPTASVDTIFICNVLHHIRDRPAYYAKLRRALRPGGRIVIIDFYKRPLPVGPPVAAKLHEDDVARELLAAGFLLSQKRAFLPHQYYLEFR